MFYIANVGATAKGPMFFNLGKPVGAGVLDDSLSADVQIVQFFLSCLGFYTYRGSATTFSGHNDAETAAAIKAYQESKPDLTRDGRVSVAQGLTFGPGTTWTIIALNRDVRLANASTWPRLMDFEKKPPPLMANRVGALLGAGYSWITD